MTSEQWERVKAVVGDALEYPEEERFGFVLRACAGDTALRREVESMLAVSGSKLEACAEGLASTWEDQAAARLGQRIGAYELIREIGRGGMGTVYLARRADEEFEKEVAIKLLKRGTDTDEVLRRFRAEREILARLEHPNIAHLIDAGTTDNGLPYFVMECVVGVTITEFCSANHLGVDDRLRLFLKICAAIQFAHQHLVVHRDVKPANIVVTAEGEPKLLDFGIAKLLDPAEAPVTVTAVDRQRFTPDYASPEQVRGESITTVSDVYSLGALLYELLAGASPHRFSTKHPSPTELLRVVAEQEPLRPSSVATEAAQKTRLRGDLDNILLQALRKEPARRYPGVNALAEDIRRHLNNFPVRARKDTVGYRASKFIRRHRAGVTAAALVVIALISGITVAAWQAHVASLERAKAVQRFNQVRELARSVMFDYHDQIASLPGSTTVRHRLVQDSLKYLDNLSREAGNDHGLLRELASAYEKIGLVQGNSYYSNLGDTEGGLKSYRRSLEIRQNLLAADPGNRELQNEVAASYEGVGDILNAKGDLRACLETYERARELRERVTAAPGSTIPQQLALAELYAKISQVKGSDSYANVGDSAGALASARQGQNLLEPLHTADPANADISSVLSTALTNVSNLIRTTGDLAGALALQRRAVALMEKVSAAHPDNQNYAGETLGARNFLRLSLEDSGQLAEAVEQTRHVLAGMQKLLEADPQNTQIRRNVGVTYNSLGKNLLLTGDVAGALENHQKALAISEELSQANPDSDELKIDVAFTLQRLAEARAASGDHAAALENSRRALALREPVVASDPANSRARSDVSLFYSSICNSLAATGDFTGALEAIGKALPLAEEVSTRAPTNAKWRSQLAQRHADAGRVHIRIARTHPTSSPAAQTEWQRARDHLSRSAAVWQELRDKNALIPADTAKAEKVQQDLAVCDAALE